MVGDPSAMLDAIEKRPVTNNEVAHRWLENDGKMLSLNRGIALTMKWWCISP